MIEVVSGLAIALLGGCFLILKTLFQHKGKKGLGSS